MVYLIHVIAKSKISGDAFLKSHPKLAAKLVIEVVQLSYLELLGDVIKKSTQAYVCVVSDDVLLCEDFIQLINNLVQQLDRDWPNWGLVGNTGMLSMSVGYATSDVVRYKSDPIAGPNMAGHILPAQSIDGNVMLLNVRAMRDAGLTFPSFDDFYWFDTVLSIETISAGLGVYVAPQLACWHGSVKNLAELDKAKSNDVFVDYLQTRLLANHSVKTVNGELKIVVEAPKSAGLDLDLDLGSLRVAVHGRHKHKVAVVTRTQFTRMSLLKRTLESVGVFIKSAGTCTEFISYVVTDSEIAAPEWVNSYSTLLRADLPCGIDSRYQLVRFAAENIDADYFWFVDDDDWLLPNEAERLSLVISGSPQSSIFFVDSQCYQEKPGSSGDIDDVQNYQSEAGHYFLANRFLASLSGNNHTPFCGVLFNRSALLAIPSHVYDTVTYFEDYMTTLYALLVRNCFPVVIDRLFVGISIRETGNTVTETDRSKWNQSMSEMVSHLVNAPDISHLLSLPSSIYLNLHQVVLDRDEQINGLNQDIVKRDKAIVERDKAIVERDKAIVERDDQIFNLNKIIDETLRSTSWRLTRPVRFVGHQLLKIKSGSDKIEK